MKVSRPPLLTSRVVYFVSATAIAGYGIVRVPLPSAQLAIVVAAGAGLLSIVMARANRVLDPAWVVVAYTYAIVPIGALLLGSAVGLSLLPALALALIPYVVLALWIRPQARGQLVLILPLLGLLALAVLSIAWTSSAAQGVEKVGAWVANSLVPAVAIMVLATASRRVAWSLIIGAAFAYAIGTLVVGAETDLYPGRLTLLGENPIWVARACFVGVLATVFGPVPNIVKVALIPPMVVAGLLTLSLGPTLGLLLGLLAGALVHLRVADIPERRRPLGYAAIGFGTAVLLLVVASGVTDPVWARLAEDPNVTSRSDFLGVSAELFLGAPLLGLGISGFASAGLGPYPHNLVAEVAVELGIAGLAILAVWVGVALRGAWESPARMALLVGTGAFALFSGDLSGNVEFWLFSALAVAFSPMVGRLRAPVHGPLVSPYQRSP